MSDPCIRAVSDEQVLGSNRYLECEERAKAFKAPVMSAFSESPIFHKNKKRNYTNQIRSSAAAKVVKAPTIIAGCIDVLNEFVVDSKRSFKSKKRFDDETT